MFFANFVTKHYQSLSHKIAQITQIFKQVEQGCCQADSLMSLRSPM